MANSALVGQKGSAQFLQEKAVTAYFVKQFYLATRGVLGCHHGWQGVLCQRAALHPAGETWVAVVDRPHQLRRWARFLEATAALPIPRLTRLASLRCPAAAIVALVVSVQGARW